MLNIRPIRLKNVVRQSVVTKCRRWQVAFCSTQTTTPEPDRIDESGPETKKRLRFEALPEEGELKFKIPGLSVREETFVKQQTRIILRPDCMKEMTLNKGNSFSSLIIIFFID
jgi:hypothetical protein